MMVNLYDGKMEVKFDLGSVTKFGPKVFSLELCSCVMFLRRSDTWKICVLFLFRLEYTMYCTRSTYRLEAVEYRHVVTYTYTQVWLASHIHKTLHSPAQFTYINTSGFPCNCTTNGGKNWLDAV